MHAVTVLGRFLQSDRVASYGWVSTAAWLALGGGAKLVADLNGGGVVARAFIGPAVSQTIAIAECVLSASMMVFTRYVPLRWIIIGLLSLFCIFHFVGELYGQARCGCFGALVIPDWVTVLVNAALACVLLANVTAEPTRLMARAAIPFAIAASILVSHVWRAGASGPIPTQDAGLPDLAEPSLVLSGPLYEFIQSRYVGGADKHVYVYDPACAACAQEFPRRLEAALSDRRNNRSDWIFINVGVDDDARRATWESFCEYVHFADDSITPPCHLRISGRTIQRLP